MKRESCTVVLLALGSLPFIMLIGALLNGWVLSIMWGWFVVPVFGLPALTIVQAIGLAMVVSYLTYHAVDTQKDERSLGAQFAVLIATTIARPLFALVIAWVVHMFL